MSLLTSRRSWWAALGAVAAAFAVSGIAYASIPSPDGVIHGCYTKSGGSLRVIDDSVTNCKSGETSLNWNQTGARGPTGQAGPTGVTGPSGPVGPQGPSSAQSISASFVPLSGKTTVATMNVGAGAYAIQTKTVVADDAAESVYVFCFLDVNNPADEDISATMVGTGSARQTVVLQLTHTFTSAGTITLSCQPTNPPNTTNVGTELTKITAVKVDTETH